MLELLEILAFSLLDLPMFPLFDIAHDYLAAVDVRHTWGADFGRKSPVSCVVSWLLTISTAFAGGLIASFIFQGSLLPAIADTSLVLLATAVWLAVSYSPYDICYRFGENFTVKVILNALKEIYRVKKIHMAVFQSGWMIPQILICVIKANGAGVFKQFWQIVQKTRFPRSGIEIQTSYTTKVCLLAAILFVMKYRFNFGGYALSVEMLHLGITVFFVGTKVYHLAQLHSLEKHKRD